MKPDIASARRRSIPAMLTASLVLMAGLVASVVVPSSPALAAPQNWTCLYYAVRRGDTMSRIGRQYGVTMSMLMQMNGLRNTRVYRGQRLCIPRNKPVAKGPPVAQPGTISPYPAYPPYQPPCDPYHCGPIPYGPIPYPPTPYGAFPCTKPYFNESNLCILQPYPVKIGTTAYAVWNITDFSYGEFDKGDGQGFKGPISHEQKVDIPNVTGPRTVQLRWKDRAGNWHYDSFWIQVVY